MVGTSGLALLSPWEERTEKLRSNMTVPLRDAPEETVASLRSRLLDGTAPLAARYRALFGLRNVAGADAEAALVSGAFFCWL